VAELSLKDRAVLITGPAKGMGRAITLAVAEAGGDVALLGRDLAPIEAVAREARARGVTALVFQADVTSDTDIEQAVAAAADRLGERLWGAVAVAGVAGPSGRALWEHTPADFHDIFDVNVLGVFLLLRHLLPRLIANGGGSVVTIGGTFGFKGVRRASLYGASKWALRGLTKSAALEAGHAGVRVNMVSPGGVDGPRLTRQLGEQAAREGIAYAEVQKRFAAGSALGRMSKDDDVAAAVLFLLAETARNITGQDLLVDGGTIV
jgi:NAD(P)-dependent dehydrogenase (short-subunit alcohol dehydrogenase family)